jgi:hypothetical protein
MRSVAAVAVLAAIPATASAQADPVELSLTLAQREGGTTTLSVYGRFTWAEGGDAFGELYEWDDLFKAGPGVGVEIAHLWGVSNYQGGIFLAVQADELEGDERTDIVGDKLEPDDLRFGSLLVGGKAEVRWTSWMGADFRLGVGPALYDNVDADATLSGVGFGDLELYDRSVAFTGEISGRLAVGPLFVGGGLRYVGPPDRGSDFTRQTEPKEILAPFVEFGLTLRF